VFNNIKSFSKKSKQIFMLCNSTIKIKVGVRLKVGRHFSARLLKLINKIKKNLLKDVPMLILIGLQRKKRIFYSP